MDDSRYQPEAFRSHVWIANSLFACPTFIITLFELWVIYRSRKSTATDIFIFGTYLGCCIYSIVSFIFSVGNLQDGGQVYAFTEDQCAVQALLLSIAMNIQYVCSTLAAWSAYDIARRANQFTMNVGVPKNHAILYVFAACLFSVAFAALCHGLSRPYLYPAGTMCGYDYNSVPYSLLILTMMCTSIGLSAWFYRQVFWVYLGRKRSNLGLSNGKNDRPIPNVSGLGSIPEDKKLPEHTDMKVVVPIRVETNSTNIIDLRPANRTRSTDAPVRAGTGELLFHHNPSELIAPNRTGSEQAIIPRPPISRVCTDTSKDPNTKAPNPIDQLAINISPSPVPQNTSTPSSVQQVNTSSSTTAVYLPTPTPISDEDMKITASRHRVIVYVLCLALSWLPTLYGCIETFVNKAFGVEVEIMIGALYTLQSLLLPIVFGMNNPQVKKYLRACSYHCCWFCCIKCRTCIDSRCDRCIPGQRVKRLQNGDITISKIIDDQPAENKVRPTRTHQVVNLSQNLPLALPNQIVISSPVIKDSPHSTITVHQNVTFNVAGSDDKIHLINALYRPEAIQLPDTGRLENISEPGAISSRSL